MGLLVVVVVGIALAAYQFGWFPGTGGIPEGGAVGMKAPGFNLPDVSGNKKYSLADYAGKKPVLVEFMWTECPHCQAFAPIVARAYDNYKGQVAFLSIAADPRDSRSLVERFSRAHFSQWPYLMGSSGDMTLYSVEGYPTTFLIDRQGVIRKRIDGDVSYDTLRSDIAGLLDR